MDERKKYVTVVEAEQYENGFPPEQLRDFMAWLEGHVATIPAEFRDTATVEIRTTARYGDYYALIDISYVRPMTDQEIAAEEAAQAARLAADEASQRRAYEALKRKFEA